MMNHVGVYGYGVAAKGILQVLAKSGYQVTAIGPTRIISNVLKNDVQHGLEDQNSMSKMFLPDDLRHEHVWMKKIDFTTNLDTIAKFKLPIIFEVFPDDLKEKRNAIERLLKVARQDTILAVHTESLLLRDIFAGIDRQDRFIGAHFAHPIPEGNLVEITKLPSTSKTTVKAVKNLIETMGRKYYMCKDESGFLANRLVAALLREKARAIQENSMDYKDVDRLFQLVLKSSISLSEIRDAIGPNAMQRLLNENPQSDVNS